MDHSFLCGILIGLIFGMPVGAVGAMTVQRTLRYGIKGGLLTGFGSSAADCFYASVGAFGMTFISDFLLSYKTVIHIAGGIFIVFMGVHLIRLKQKSSEGVSDEDPKKGILLFISSFTIGITNPAAIMTFLFAFSYFGLSDQMGLISGIQLVFGVFIGTYLWWGFLAFGITGLKKKVHIHRFGKWNQIFGALLISFGIVVLGRTLIS